MRRAPLSPLLIPLLLLGASCGGGDTRPTPKPRPRAEPVERAPDFFDEFGGARVDAGQSFRLGNDPIGVDGVRVVVSLSETEWISREDARGDEIKEAIAVVLIQKGEEVARLRLHAGERGTKLGVTVLVEDAGEDYDEPSMRWFGYARLVVSAATP